MNIPFIDLQRQYKRIREEVLSEIDLILSNEINNVLENEELYLGRNVTQFEKEFAELCGTKYAVSVGSGTDALLLSLISMGIGRGDEVITVANTFISTVAAIHFAGAKSILVDIDKISYNINTSLIEENVTSKTKAIIPVHLYGQPADMDDIREIAQYHDLKIIEDACQAHGAEYGGRRTGSLGDAGCFSFQLTKNLSAFGEGGMVVSDNEELVQNVKALREHGQVRKSDHRVFGFNSRLDEIQAAILRIKLKRIHDIIEKRRRNAQLYGKLLNENGLIIPQELPRRKHVYHLYVIRTRNRDNLQKYLLSQGISTKVHYPVPIHQQEAWIKTYEGVELPVTENVCKEILSLPIYDGLNEEEVKGIAEEINQFQNDSGR